MGTPVAIPGENGEKRNLESVRDRVEPAQAEAVSPCPLRGLFRASSARDHTSRGPPSCKSPFPARALLSALLCPLGLFGTRRGRLSRLKPGGGLWRFPGGWAGGGGRPLRRPSVLKTGRPPGAAAVEGGLLALGVGDRGRGGAAPWPVARSRSSRRGGGGQGVVAVRRGGGVTPPPPPLAGRWGRVRVAGRYDVGRGQWARCGAGRDGVVWCWVGSAQARFCSWGGALRVGSRP